MRQKNPINVVMSDVKGFIPIVIIYSICISFLVLATPISVQSLVNTFSFGPFFQPLFIVSMLLLAFLAILTILKSLQFIVIESLQRRLYASLVAKINRVYMLKKDLGRKTDQDISLANRYFDVIVIQKKAAFLVSEGIALVLQMVLGLLLISVYHPFFLVLSLVIIVLTFLPLFVFGKTATETAVDESSSKYKTADWVEQLAHDRDIPENIEDQIKESDEVAANFLKKRADHFKVIFRQNILYMCSFAFLNTLLLALGGYLVIANQLSVGQLVAAEIVVNGILYNFLYAHKYLESFFDLYAACAKVKIFYDIEEELRVEDKKEHNTVLFSSKKYHEKFFQLFRSIRSEPSPRSPGVALKRFLLGAFLFLVFFLVTPWMQTSHGNGTVTSLDPNDRAQFITATVSGRIEKWLVKEGDFVKEGDPIVKVLDNDPDFLFRLESQRDAAVKKFEAAREASDTARINYRRQGKLMKEGLASRKDFEKANITYKKLLSEEAAAAASLAKAEVTLSRQRLQVISAPREGRILRILHGSGTVNVKTGDELVQFVPTVSEAAVEIFLPGNDLPLVFPGRKVRLQFEGWPALQFSGWPSVAIGSFGGVVKIVDPMVDSSGLFRVLVAPDLEDPVPWPSQKFLRQGSRVLGMVILGQVTIGYELWRQVNGFPKSMEGSPVEKDLEKTK